MPDQLSSRRQHASSEFFWCVCVFNHITNTGFLLGSLPFHFCPADSVLCNYFLIFKSSSIRVNTPTKYDDKPSDTFWAVRRVVLGSRYERVMEKGKQRSRMASRIAHCSDCRTSHAAPVHQCPSISLVHLSSPCLFFISPHEIPGRAQLGHMGLPGKHHLGWVDLFPWFLRSSGEGRRRKSGTKASLPFSSLNAHIASLRAEELDLTCWLI